MKVSERINGRVLRFVAQQFFGEQVGTYCIELPNHILLVDLPTYSEGIEQLLCGYSLPLHCILTHGSCGIADGKLWQKKVELKVYLHEGDRDNEWLEMEPDVFFSKPPLLSEEIEIIHTPGHKPGSVCVLEKQTKSLFVGDTIGGENGAIKDMRNDSHDDNGALRIESCRKLLDYDFENILPFHYQSIIGNAKQKLAYYLNRL